jgi:S1-C subfamily serine protease
MARAMERRLLCCSGVLVGTNLILPLVAVVALGYPLSGVLAAETNVSVGNVSALAGIADDSRYLQISAPVQPGNSGRPLLDVSGHLVGIVTAKLDAVRIARCPEPFPC